MFSKLEDWNNRVTGLPDILINYLDRKFRKDREELKPMYVLNWVNVFVNGYSYVPDEEDYWQTISEFMKKRGGDCEDFQLAKFQMLVEYFNFEANQFKLFLVWDTKKNNAHAILVCDINNGQLVLDNQVRKVTQWHELNGGRYIPLFAFNMETLEEVELDQ